MSTLRVSAEPLAVHPHPDADRLELAQVGLYRAVVAKGAFQDGEYGIYVPEQALLPAALVEELGLTGKLAGGAGNRVKAVRLRGELSQGIVCRPAALADVDLAAAHAAGTDFAAQLGIVKWTQPVPPQMAGEAEPAPDLLPWVDIEHLQRYPGAFTPGEPVIATEKLHGSCLVLTVVRATGRVQVSSKGLAAGRIAIRDDGRNLYWRAVHRHGLADAARAIAAELDVERVGVYGEVYGAGVQDLHYGADARSDERLGFAAFDVQVDDGAGPRWLDAPDALALLIRHEVPTVPVLHDGPFDAAALLALASGPTTLAGGHLREGLVVRPRADGYSPLLGGRRIAKVVSPAYLTRGGDATEYE